jgi:hypothetical protein
MGTTLSPRKRTNPDRNRLELRADPEWIARLIAAANRVGLSTSSYIRLAVSRLMEDPQFSPPVVPVPAEQPKRSRKPKAAE